MPELTTYVKNPGFKGKGRKAKIVNYYTLYSLHYARLNDILKLQEIRSGYCRNNDGVLIEEGQREFMCFLYRYWNCCYSNDTKQALENTLEFNQGFKKPLASAEAEKITVQAEKAYAEWLLDSPNGIYKRGGYNYKNETLISLLNITDHEMLELITIISPGEKLRRKLAHEREARRNEEGLTKREQQKQEKEIKIKELISKGYNMNQVAKELGINRSTISRHYKYLFI